MKKILRYVFALVVVGGGWWLVQLIWFKPTQIDHFFERVFIEFALDNPELLSSVRIAEQLGIRWHNSRLTNVSPENDAEAAAKFAKNWAILKQYSRQSLSRSQQLSYDVLDYFLSDAVAGTPYIYHNYPVNQLAGIQSELPDFMLNTHHLGDRRDADDYVSRLSKFDDKFAQVLSGLRLRESKQIIPPQFVIEKVLKEIANFTQSPPEQHLLYAHLQAQLDSVPDLDKEDKADLLTRASAALRESVYPAYDSLETYLHQLYTKANNDDGVWKLPQGDAYYAYILRQQTTSDLSPDSVHRLGIAEIARISADMRRIFSQLGYSAKLSVGDNLRKITDDPRFQYPETDAGRAQCLADYQAIIDEIDTVLQQRKVFGLRPKSSVKVLRVPEFKQATAPGAYYEPPATDGSREGVFYANLRTLRDIPRWSMRTLAYHEAIPGHHFQLGIAQTLDSLPTFRQLVPFTAYVEGWALYAEQLAWELGFQHDPYSNLGRLQAELFRAVRLVVDTGIHSKCWTREQAIEFMEETTGLGHTDVVSEIERYIVNPGQACAYKIGMIKILQLREQAKARLGDRFDLREFHNAILQHGSLPLQCLEQEVERYVKSKL